jgi:alpha-1,6-mannosyltransferase
MHVADVTMFYAPQGGGVRRYIEAKRQWLRGLAGCTHSLLVPKARRAPAEADTIGLPSVPLPFSNGYRMPLGRTPAARTLVRLRPTVIEAGDPYMLAWASLAAGNSLAAPVVAFCHSDMPRLLGRHYGARAERIAALYCGRLYRRFDLVLAPSRTMTERLHGWGVGNAIHQPLGVDVDVFHPRRRDASLKRRLGLPARSRLLVYAGRFAPEKNLEVLVEAMRRVGPGHIALLVGAGKAPAHLPPNVRVLSYVSAREELAALLASCDAFVHAGDQETFGLAALEAMACGIPVVGANAGGIAELVQPGAGLLVPPRDARALANGIHELFARDRAAMGVDARRLAQGYAWPAVLHSILGHYAALGKRIPH